MTQATKNKMNFWANRKVSHWKKKNEFKAWNNLTSFQRKVLTKDIKEHLIQMFELGRETILEEIKQMI